jgi:hypothetical protein
VRSALSASRAEISASLAVSLLSAVSFDASLPLSSSSSAVFAVSVSLGSFLVAGLRISADVFLLS